MGYSYNHRVMYGVMVRGESDGLKAFFAEHGYPVDDDKFDDMGWEALTQNCGDNIEVAGVEHGYEYHVVGVEVGNTAADYDKAVAEFTKYFPNTRDAELHDFTQIL